MISPMCDRSNSPAARRTARCSAVSLPYRSGISQPAKPVSVAPSRSCTARRGVGRGGLVSGFGDDPGTTEWYAGRMELLTNDQITAELAESPGWSLKDGEITRAVQK